MTDSFLHFVDLTCQIILKFGAVLIYSPVFLFPGLLVAALGGWISRVYIAAQMAVKRETSNARSPVYSHFNAAVAGLTTVRAFGAEDAYKLEIQKRIDYYTRPACTSYNLNRSVAPDLARLSFVHLTAAGLRWIELRLDVLGAIFPASLGAYLVYWHSKWVWTPTLTNL